MREVMIPHKPFRTFCYALFSEIGIPKKIYTFVVDGLIETSLRGVDSHGVRLIPHYVRAAILGRINKNPQFSFKKTSSTTGILDADHGYGIAAGITAMKKAIQLAEKSGVGAVTVKNSSHFGAAAIFSLLAAKNNMIGLSFTNVDSLVLPYGGKRAFLGTNPICFAAPCEGEDPFCLDMATSQIAWNKVLLYRSQNKDLGSGWAADKDGRVSTNPEKAVSLLPIGTYKGYGLALMVEILCSLLTGMPYGSHIKPMYPLDRDKRLLGHFFMVIDIAKFQDINVFKQRMRKLAEELRHEPPAPGFNKVRVAGDPEKEYHQLRSKTGIPVTKQELDKLINLAQELHLEKEYIKLLGSFLKGVLFDYDGVLVNTMEDNFRAWHHAFAQYGATITKDDYMPLEGMTTHQKAERIGDKYGVDKKHFHDIVDLKEEFYRKNNRLKVYGGVRSILKKLKSKGIKLGLVSSVSDIRIRNVTPRELLSLFDVIITGDVINYAKPDPEPYEKALQLLDLHPNETVVIEDAPLGIQAAKAANIYCIAICSTMDRNYLRQADIIVEKFADLKRILIDFL